MPRITIACISLVIAGGSAWFSFQSSDHKPVSAPKVERQWVKLTFGLDQKATDWDGRLWVENGKILKMESWGFERDHQLDDAARSWKCSSYVNRVREQATYAEPYRGVLLEIKITPKSVLRVRTLEGNFDVPLEKLAAGRPARFLKERASAQLLPSGRPLFGAGGWQPQQAQPATQDDFPTLAVDDQGHRWVAWIGYNHQQSRDQLFLLNLDDPRATTKQIEGPRLRASPLLLAAPGTLWLFWSQPLNDDWEIFGIQHQQGRWSSPHRITSGAGSDFQLAGTTGPAGELWLSWQSFRHGNSDVYAKYFRDGHWSEDIRVTDASTNEWEPSISVDSGGRAWIAYDSYVNGNYDIFLQSLLATDDGHIERSGPIEIATSEDFEAHASVQATGDKIWIAYDAAGPNWGKDLAGSKTEFRGKYADALHANRRIELRVYESGQLGKPTTRLPQQLDTFRPTSLAHKYQGEVRRFYELPQLERDQEGRLWVFFRLNRQGYAEDPQAALWEIYATTFVDGQWLEPMLLPESWGRQNQRLATAIALRRPQGQDQAPPGLHCAWSRGHHMNDMDQRVRVGRLPFITGSADDPPIEKHQLSSVAKTSQPAAGSWPLKRGGETYHVYFGDLHRHTDISWCYPTVDGSPVDAFRYALDAARLDFLAITDHTRDTDPYPWWYTQKANDLFNIPQIFTTIYGYERSNSTPGGGHRNVFFVQRDWPVFRSEAHFRYVPDANPGRLDPPAALYPHLRGKDAFTAAHTPAYSVGDQRGTWTYGDDEVEPLVEIYQGFRQSYERPGNGVTQEASIWHALNKGYRLGFIASSDHVSTHVSFACVWAEENSRESLFEAMRARRTYAATDKIILDVRIGNALMGEQTTTAGDPELSIHVRGTAKIDELQVVRNAQVIWRSSPGQQETRTRFVDRRHEGPAWYYVRVRQQDGAFAWGSPIWVN